MQQQDNEMTAEMIIDFHVRWNTTYIMTDRFCIYKPIVNQITNNPELIDGLTKTQKKSLNNLKLNNSEWIIIETLRDVLKPFFYATKIVSGKKYETLSINKIICSSIDAFLNGVDVEDNFEDKSDDEQIRIQWNQFLKSNLKSKFNHYFTTPRMSQNQIDSGLVSSLVN